MRQKSNPWDSVPAGDRVLSDGFTVNSLRRGTLTTALAAGVSFLATGAFITKWDGPPTVIGAVCVGAFVLGAGELTIRRRRGPRL